MWRYMFSYIHAGKAAAADGVGQDAGNPSLPELVPGVILKPGMA